jgi:hypothetical protein
VQFIAGLVIILDLVGADLLKTLAEFGGAIAEDLWEPAANLPRTALLGILWITQRDYYRVFVIKRGGCLTTRCSAWV